MASSIKAVQKLQLWRCNVQTVHNFRYLQQDCMLVNPSASSMYCTDHIL